MEWSDIDSKIGKNNLIEETKEQNMWDKKDINKDQTDLKKIQIQLVEIKYSVIEIKRDYHW